MRHSKHYLPWVLVTGGVASVFHIIPFASGVDCCCVPTAAIAGFASTVLVSQQARARLGAGEGAYVGLLSGLFCGLLGGLIGAIKVALSASIESALCRLGACRESSEHALVEGAVGAVVVFGFVLFTSPLLGALGGLVASALPMGEAPPPQRDQ